MIWPWMGSFDPKELPQYEEIKQALAFAGKLARAYDQRVTFHPSHFVKLGGPVEALTQKSINELEGHAQVMMWEGLFLGAHSWGVPSSKMGSGACA